MPSHRPRLRLTGPPSGGFLRWTDGGYYLLTGTDLGLDAGIGGLIVLIDGVERTDAVRGVSLETRLDDVGTAEVTLNLAAAAPLPETGAALRIEDRQTRRVLYDGIVDEPEVEVLRGRARKVMTVRAVDGMRRLENVRLSTADGVAVAREPTWQAQARAVVAALQAASAHDAQFSLAAGDWADTTPAGAPAEHDFRGETIAGALRAIVEVSGDGTLYVDPDRMIRRAARQTAGAAPLAVGAVDRAAYDISRQTQVTRSCVIGAAPFTLTDLFTTEAPHYDIGRSEARISVFESSTPITDRPGVLWEFRTAVPGGFFASSDYQSDNRGIYATTHVKGDDPTWPAIWRAPTALVAGSTSAEAYVVGLDWNAARVTLDLGATDRDRTAAIDWAAGVEPWVLARNLAGQVSRARLAPGADPVTADVTADAVQHRRLEDRIETDTVIVDAAVDAVDVGLATTANRTGPARPPIRVMRLTGAALLVPPGPDDRFELPLTTEDGDPIWALDVARHRVTPTAHWTGSGIERGLELTYEAVWEVEANAGGALPVIRIETADAALSRAEASEAALRAIARDAAPVQEIDLTLTAAAARHLTPGDRLTLDAAWLATLGVPGPTVTSSAPTDPVWIVDAVSIEDNGDRLIYGARLVKDRHQSEYGDFWRRVAG